MHHFKGSPIQARDLRAAGLLHCFSCVIINSKENSNDVSDKNSVICATLIQSLMKEVNVKLNVLTEISKFIFINK